VGWYSLLIYNIYFNDDNDSINNYSSGSGDNGVIIDRLEIEHKDNMKCTQQKKSIDLGYLDPLDYKFTIIVMIDLFKGYIDMSRVNERLKLIYKIVIHLQLRKKRNWRALIGYPQDRGMNNLNSRTSYF
jgi:hypothetical protein